VLPTRPLSGVKPSHNECYATFSISPLQMYSLALANSIIGQGFWPGKATGKQRYPAVPHRPSYKYRDSSKKATSAQIAKAHSRQAFQQDLLLKCWASAQGRPPRPPKTLARGPRGVRFPSGPPPRASRPRAPSKQYPSAPNAPRPRGTYVDPSLLEPKRQSIISALDDSNQLISDLEPIDTSEARRAMSTALEPEEHYQEPYTGFELTNPDIVAAQNAYQAASSGLSRFVPGMGVTWEEMDRKYDLPSRSYSPVGSLEALTSPPESEEPLRLPGLPMDDVDWDEEATQLASRQWTFSARSADEETARIRARMEAARQRRAVLAEQAKQRRGRGMYDTYNPQPDLTHLLLQQFSHHSRPMAFPSDELEGGDF